MTLKLAIFVPSNPARTRMNAEFVGFIRGDNLSAALDLDELLCKSAARLLDYPSSSPR